MRRTAERAVHRCRSHAVQGQGIHPTRSAIARRAGHSRNAELAIGRSSADAGIHGGPAVRPPVPGSAERHHLGGRDVESGASRVDPGVDPAVDPAIDRAGRTCGAPPRRTERRTDRSVRQRAERRAVGGCRDSRAPGRHRADPWRPRPRPGPDRRSGHGRASIAVRARRAERCQYRAVPPRSPRSAPEAARPPVRSPSSPSRRRWVTSTPASSRTSRSTSS